MSVNAPSKDFKQITGEGHADLKEDAQLVGDLWALTGSDLTAHLASGALTKIDGTYGLAVVSSRDPGKIVAVRNGPPIVVGMGDG